MLNASKLVRHLFGHVRIMSYLCRAVFPYRKTHTRTLNPFQGLKVRVQGGILPLLDYPLRVANHAVTLTQNCIMAKGSKSGACSSHTDKAKANCLAHDRREGKVPSYVNPHLSHMNRIVFEDEMIRGRKSIVPLVQRAEKEYTEKTGQKCQGSFAPFRESALKIREGVTDEQLMKFKADAERLTGWKCIGIYLHLDEGHYRSKYIEGDESFALNHHAHVLWSCQDHQTGKSIKCTRKQLSMMQDLLAAATGMERGNKAAETGIKGRSAQAQRIKAQEERIERLESIAKSKDDTILAKDAEIAQKDNQIAQQQKVLNDIADQIDKISKTKAIKDAAVAKLVEFADRARAAGDTARARGKEALEVSKGAAQWVADKFGFTEEAKTIEEQAKKILQLEADQKTAQSKIQETIKEGIASARRADKEREGKNNRALYLAATGKGHTIGDEGKDPNEVLTAIRELAKSRDLWQKSSERLKEENKDLKKQLTQGEDQRRGITF